MAVVAVPFILYLVRFCSSKSCTVLVIESTALSYSTRTRTVRVLLLGGCTVLVLYGGCEVRHQQAMMLISFN